MALMAVNHQPSFFFYSSRERTTYLSARSQQLERDTDKEQNSTLDVQVLFRITVIKPVRRPESPGSAKATVKQHTPDFRLRIHKFLVSDLDLSHTLMGVFLAHVPL